MPYVEGVGWTDPSSGGLTVEEADGSPTVAASKLVVPNDSLTVDGTNAELDFATGGGGGGDGVGGVLYLYANFK